MGKNKRHKTKPHKIKSSLRDKKVLLAQKHNQFMRILRRIAMASDALDAFNLIPQDELECIWKIRFQPFCVKAENREEIPPSDIHEMQEFIRYYLKNKMITIVDPKVEISLYDYSFAGMTLIFYLLVLKDKQFRAAPEVKKGFAQLLEFHQVKRTADIMILNFGIVLAGFYSKLDGRLYSFRYELVTIKTPPVTMFCCFWMTGHAHEKIMVSLDDHIRPAYRVIWPRKPNIIKAASIHPIDININTSFSQLPIDIYVQSHALIRLYERLDTLPEYLIQYCLCESLFAPKTVTTSSGQVFIEYHYCGVKVGYLPFDFVDGIVCIRTFLFLTNSGTPEGEKLHKMFGLKKTDTSYFAIDRLSTFTQADVVDDQRLVKLFSLAGCGELFKLTVYKAKEAPILHQAAAIAQYLGLRKGEDKASVNL